jgi:hypothetical protein
VALICIEVICEEVISEWINTLAFCCGDAVPGVSGFSGAAGLGWVTASSASLLDEVGSAVAESSFTSCANALPLDPAEDPGEATVCPNRVDGEAEAGAGHGKSAPAGDIPESSAGWEEDAITPRWSAGGGPTFEGPVLNRLSSSEPPPKWHRLQIGTNLPEQMDPSLCLSVHPAHL